jgi:hypothetical protein
MPIPPDSKKEMASGQNSIDMMGAKSHYSLNLAVMALCTHRFLAYALA